MESRTEFRKGLARDAGEIAALVNSSYRGESSKTGWTTEAHLLGGQRTDAAEVSGLMEKTGSIFILCMTESGLTASVHLEHCGNDAHLGMLAVKPDLQGRGIGKRLLDEAERTAIESWGVNRMKMAVLTFRAELIQFYERRGYRRTGIFRPFPEDPKFGIPKVRDLRFEWLEKPLLNPPISWRS